MWGLIVDWLFHGKIFCEKSALREQTFANSNIFVQNIGFDEAGKKLNTLEILILLYSNWN